MQQLITGGIDPPRKTVKQRKRDAEERKAARAAVEDLPSLENPPYQFPLASPEETDFRHAHWSEKREKVRNAMIGVNVSGNALTAYDNCGAQVTIEWSDTEKRYRMRGSYCRCRHCEPCAKQKANIIARNLKAKLEDTPNVSYRFITLTLRHTDTPLIEQIRRLYDCFKKLRSKACWKATQHGGSASLEVKWNPTTRMWHPHLHIISQGIYLDKRDLVHEWHTCTGDSFVADIRVIADAKSAAYYVGKYVTKGTNDAVWDDPSAAQEWLTATKGVRTCSTFGKWRGFALTKFVPTTTDWKPIASLTRIQKAAKNGEEWAIGIMINLLPSADPEEVRSRYQMYTGDG
jgi:hypothetical protein